MAMDLGSLGAAIPAYMYSQNVGQYTQPQQNLLSAMTDTNNPLYKNIYNQQKQQGQQSLGDMISQLTAQNRKLSAMGRTPLFGPERGGEQLFRQLMQGYQANQNTAASNTQDILKNGFMGQMYTDKMQADNALQKARGQSGVGGMIGTALGNGGGISGLLKGIFGL